MGLRSVPSFKNLFSPKSTSSYRGTPLCGGVRVGHGCPCVATRTDTVRIGRCISITRLGRFFQAPFLSTTKRICRCIPNDPVFWKGFRRDVSTADTVPTAVEVSNMKKPTRGCDIYIYNTRYIFIYIHRRTRYTPRVPQSNTQGCLLPSCDRRCIRPFFFTLSPFQVRLPLALD